MLLLGEHDLAVTGHDSFDANRLVMVTLRQPASDCDEQGISAANATLCPPDAFDCLIYAFPVKTADAPK